MGQPEFQWRRVSEPTETKQILPDNPTYRYTFSIPGSSGKNMSGINWRAVLSFIIGIVLSLSVVFEILIKPFSMSFLMPFSCVSVIARRMKMESRII
ncbi:hypothetical protein N7449_000965 [Penicillium cf. viridicatum]|uniref:Uncharacterized protein n=1 Tax=Penicillium cf. viridicatum TaxID=2972119 RepID=A0A9W9N5Z0_9EURO|nr:hypothetical protein N7449_000965 [Penicillium cf. viridicatum]